MNLIFFTPSKSRSDRRLIDAVENLELDAGLELHRTARSLFRRLCQPAKEILAGILFISRKEELDEIFVMRELLHDLPLIIVLAYGSDELVSRAHLLRPRFVSFGEQSIHEVPAVLDKMLRHEGGKGRT